MLMLDFVKFLFTSFGNRRSVVGRDRPIAPQQGTVRYQGEMPEIRVADIQITESYSQTRP